MSNREKTIQLLNVIDDEKMVYVLNILENLTCFAEIPNSDTIAAFQEGDDMLANGTGKRYTSTSDLFADVEA